MESAEVFEDSGICEKIASQKSLQNAGTSFCIDERVGIAGIANCFLNECIKGNNRLLGIDELKDERHSNLASVRLSSRKTLIEISCQTHSENLTYVNFRSWIYRDCTERNCRSACVYLNGKAFVNITVLKYIIDPHRPMCTLHGLHVFVRPTSACDKNSKEKKNIHFVYKKTGYW